MESRGAGSDCIVLLKEHEVIYLYLLSWDGKRLKE